MDNEPIHSESKTVPLTRAMVSRLRQLREQSGVSASTLTERLDPARGISARSVDRWRLGQTAAVCPVRYALVLESWQSLADSYVFRMPETLAAIEQERQRTGVAAYEIFKLAGKPAGITRSSLVHFCAGRQKRLLRAPFDLVMETWRALPDKSPLVVLTPEIVETLRAHRLRTGKGPQALLAGIRDRPRDFHSTTAGTWLSGNIPHAYQTHLEFVLEQYQACPDKPHTDQPTLRELRRHVRRELRRTQIGDDALRRLLGAKQKTSWQFLGQNELKKALDLTGCLPTRPKQRRRGRIIRESWSGQAHGTNGGR